MAGEDLEYDTPTPAVRAFLARVIDASADPRVSESELVELIYGAEDPILKQGVIPNHGLVTRETLADPLYHVLTDLLGRKRVQLGTLDPERAAGEYTITVTEAAERLGVHPSAVRQAIQAHRLDAVKRGGIHLLKSRSIDSYRVSRRGPKPAEPEPALEVVVGNDEGGSFRLRVIGGEVEETGRKGHRVSGIVRSFARAAVISGGKGAYRFFELEPADAEEELAVGAFSVRGRFTIARKENNARRANEEWKAFR
jgi:excisionase family DNA binding protein